MCYAMELPYGLRRPWIFLLLSLIHPLELSWEICRHVIDILWCSPYVVQPQQYSSCVATSIFKESLYVGHTRWWPRGKSTLFIFIAFWSLWDKRSTSHEKRKKHAWKYFLPYSLTLFKLFLKYLECCALVLVSLYFEKYGLQTFPTNHQRSCDSQWPCHTWISQLISPGALTPQSCPQFGAKSPLVNLDKIDITDRYWAKFFTILQWHGAFIGG